MLIMLCLRRVSVNNDYFVDEELNCSQPWPNQRALGKFFVHADVT